jgi:hypothetical protein
MLSVKTIGLEGEQFLLETELFRKTRFPENNSVLRGIRMFIMKHLKHYPINTTVL